MDGYAEACRGRQVLLFDSRQVAAVGRVGSDSKSNSALTETRRRVCSLQNLWSPLRWSIPSVLRSSMQCITSQNILMLLQQDQPNDCCKTFVSSRKSYLQCDALREGLKKLSWPPPFPKAARKMWNCLTLTIKSSPGIPYSCSIYITLVHPPQSGCTLRCWFSMHKSFLALRSVVCDTASSREVTDSYMPLTPLST